MTPGARARDHRDDRIRRARELARRYPASAEILNFYADLTEFQRTLTDPAPSVPLLLTWLRPCAIARLAAGAEVLESKTARDWQSLIDAYLRHTRADVEAANDLELFVVEAVLQPCLERAAADMPAPATPGRECPGCHNLPMVSALRERGHSAERSLICGLCLLEWPAMRICCPGCGETGFEALPVYRAGEFSGVRIDACETCRTYVKTFDLTVSGVAIPIVDDLASLPLDLWAREQGYTRLRRNILRL